MTVEEQELKQDTEQLRQLISQVDNSGVSAWNASDLLKVVKDKKGYITGFKTFESYTKKEIGINPQTANNYTIISEKFTKEDIGNLMLVTHLRVIAEIKNAKMRKLVLKTFKEREKKEQINPQSEDTYKTKLSGAIQIVA